MNYQCIVCGQDPASYPWIDTNTGWCFCDRCWHRVEDIFYGLGESTFPNWLRAVAQAIEERKLEKIKQAGK